MYRDTREREERECGRRERESGERERERERVGVKSQSAKAEATNDDALDEEDEEDMSASHTEINGERRKGGGRVDVTHLECE